MHVMVLSFFAPCPQSCSFVLHSYSSFLLLIFSPSLFLLFTLCRNPTLAKCGGEAQHLEKVRSWSPPGLSNV
jgi:hypothetical protein